MGMKPRVEVQIDELVLRGIDPREAQRVADALRHELTRLLGGQSALPGVQRRETAIGTATAHAVLTRLGR